MSRDLWYSTCSQSVHGYSLTAPTTQLRTGSPGSNFGGMYSSGGEGFLMGMQEAMAGVTAQPWLSPSSVDWDAWNIIVRENISNPDMLVG